MLVLFVHALLARRRHLHRDRGRLERPADHARAARADRASARWLTWPSRSRSPRPGSCSATCSGRSSPCRARRMNAVLAERVAGGLAARAASVRGRDAARPRARCWSWRRRPGFLDGPRVLANMAVDSWCRAASRRSPSASPPRTASCSWAAPRSPRSLYTHGDVRALVVMYSINVFLTFSLSMLGMALDVAPRAARVARRKRRARAVRHRASCCARRSWWSP